LDIRKIKKIVYESNKIKDMKGVRINVGFGVVKIYYKNRKKVAEAYMGSWRWQGG